METILNLLLTLIMQSRENFDTHTEWLLLFCESIPSEHYKQKTTTQCRNKPEGTTRIEI